jgi:hypothetical protein
MPPLPFSGRQRRRLPAHGRGLPPPSRRGSPPRRRARHGLPPPLRRSCSALLPLSWLRACPPPLLAPADGGLLPHIWSRGPPSPLCSRRFATCRCGLAGARAAVAMASWARVQPRPRDAGEQRALLSPTVAGPSSPHPRAGHLLTPGFKEQSQVHLIHAPRRQHI